MGFQLKVVLQTKDDVGLYLFWQDNKNKVEWVVADNLSDVKIGDVVDSWANGHYFKDLEDAVAYYKKKVKIYG